MRGAAGAFSGLVAAACVGGDSREWLHADAWSLPSATALPLSHAAVCTAGHPSLDVLVAGGADGCLSLWQALPTEVDGGLESDAG